MPVELSQLSDVLGLNPNEARVYLALLELGSAPAGAISKKCQVNRTNTYDALERLIAKGLVSFVIHANRKVFQPQPLEKIPEMIHERELTARELVPELKKLATPVRESAAVYEGRKGIRAIMADILKFKDYVALGGSGQQRFLTVMRHEFVWFQRRKEERGITSRVILPESIRGTETTKVSHGKFRFVPNEYGSPTTTFIYGDRIATVVWSEVPFGAVITSKSAADGYRRYFELLWKSAKP